MAQVNEKDLYKLLAKVDKVEELEAKVKELEKINNLNLELQALTQCRDILIKLDCKYLLTYPLNIAIPNKTKELLKLTQKD